MNGDPPQHPQEAETSNLPPVAGRETIVAPVAAEMPEQIGHYHLKRRIGSGGMGTVYEAVQEHPHRIVALKVMKQGVTSRSALRRFEYESEVLARLRHPGIAQVYEAGTHDDGSGGVPFFAMEYIHGAMTLTQFVQAEDLGTEERLELFLRICDAVHHGHQKGIIHRDLKPENILVDSSGQTKIIDFGIARATDSDLRAATLQTQVGELVGTVPYMSPEQCAADPHDIDTRSDVYALGIVCYELLTGQLPYDVTDVAIYEATRIIREELPTPLAPINSELKGDIETIVMKALEKERDRRYQSAVEMAQDIRRYLASEPILARPPSVFYQFTSFARRNKALVTGITGIFLALVVGIIGTTYGLVKATQAEARAVKEATTARAVTDYFKQMFAMLDAEQTGVGSDARVSDMLDIAATDIDQTFADQPEVRAELKAAIGNGYRVLSIYKIAERELREALATLRNLEAPNLVLLADTLTGLSSALYWQRGEAIVEAEALCREALDIRRRLHGEEHDAVAESLNQLAACESVQNRYAESEQHYRAALEMRVRFLDEADPEWRQHLVQDISSAGAEASPDEALDPDLEKRMRDVAAGHNNLGTCLMRQRKYPEAVEQYEQALPLLSTLYHGEASHQVAATLSNFARCLASRHVRLDEAERYFRRSLEMKIATWDEDHASIAITRHHLADLLLSVGQRPDEAESLARRALEVRRKRFEAGDIRIGKSAALLGRILMERGRPWEAEPLLVEALPIIERLASGDTTSYEETWHILDLLAEISGSRGDREQAEAYRQRRDAMVPPAGDA